MLAYPAATFGWLTSGAAGTGGASRQGAQSCLVNYLTGKPRCAESGFNARAIVFKPLGGPAVFDVGMPSTISPKEQDGYVHK